MSTNINELANEIARAMEQYANLVESDFKKAVKDVAKETAKKIKENSPRKTGKYKKGWRSKVSSESSHKIEVAVYNSKKASLTHLLEKGHAKRGGGRVAGIPHIAPAENRAIEELENRMRRLGS